MKTFGNLYSSIISFENLLLASQKARKGKRFKESCSRFEFNLERELFLLQQELTDMTYCHGGYRNFFVFDPKQRLISAAPYRDRVVHHALCNIVEPIFDRSFIADSYACRKNKGAHAAANRYTKYARKYRYVLKCDIKKYFHSIDQDILLSIITKKITCPDIIWLINEIICSRRDTASLVYFPGDTLFTPLLRQNGIPIGNLTSQFFANVYLDGFDHFVKQTLRLPYIRYVDDFVAFAESKEQLNEAKEQMNSYLDRLRLKMHENKSRVYRVTDGVRFLGYRMFPDHRLLDKGNVLRMRRKMKKLSDGFRDGEIAFSTVHQSIQSWVGHAAHADTWKIRGKVLGSVVFQRGDAGEASGRFVEQQP